MPDSHMLNPATNWARVGDDAPSSMVRVQSDLMPFLKSRLKAGTCGDSASSPINRRTAILADMRISPESRDMSDASACADLSSSFG